MGRGERIGDRGNGIYERRGHTWKGGEERRGGYEREEKRGVGIEDIGSAERRGDRGIWEKKGEGKEDIDCMQ